MPATMARKKTKPEGPTPGRQKRYGKPVQVYLSDELSAALDAYIEAARPRPTKTAVIETALEDLLRKAGHWPPPAKEGRTNG
jgi:hypothetical protein